MVKQTVFISVGLLLLCVIVRNSAEVNLGTCSLSCDDETVMSIPTPKAAVGRPGKIGPKGNRGPAGRRGAIGPKGERGYPGPVGESSCDCGELEDILKRVKELEKVLANLDLGAVNQETTTKVPRTTSNGPGLPMTSLTRKGVWSKSIGGYRYWVSDTKETYWNAKNKCNDLGGRLASAGLQDSGTRSTIYQTIFQPLVTGYIFLGLDDVNDQKKWVWSNGIFSNSENSDWADYEPSGGEEHCGIAWEVKNWQINDVQCDIPMHFLCEKTA